MKKFIARTLTIAGLVVLASPGLQKSWSAPPDSATPPSQQSANSIRELTAEAAKTLVSNHKDIWLTLDNLNEISPEVARELADAKCAIRLGVDKLTPEVAEILATRNITLDLGLKSISPAVAEKLAMSNDWLSFSRLCTIDADSAAQLAKHKGWLSLNELKSLTPEVAEALGTFDGKRLDLMGLESLDLESAKRLANAKCAARDGIYLDSVTEVSPEVVNVLANGNSGLSLQGLEFIDDSTEQALVDAKKKLKAMGRFLERPAPSHPFLKLEFGGRNGSAKKGETLAMSWKLRGQSVESIGVQAIHIKDGESRVVSQVSCPVNGKRSMEVQFQLENLVEQLRSEGNLFLPSISVAVDGASTHAEQSEKFTMLGKFGISSYTTKSSEVGELLVAVGISDGDSTDGIDHDTTRSVEKMIVASKKGVEFLVLNLSSRFIDDVTGKFGGAARKN